MYLNIQSKIQVLLRVAEELLIFQTILQYENTRFKNILINKQKCWKQEKNGRYWIQMN